jgi:hypothetical protein
MFDRSKFRIGWELETEKVNGAKYGETFSRYQPTLPSFSEATIKGKMEAMLMGSFYGYSNSMKRKIMSAFTRVMANHGGPRLAYQFIGRNIGELNSTNTGYAWDEVRGWFDNTADDLGEMAWAVLGSPTDKDDLRLAVFCEELRLLAIDLLAESSAKTYSLTPEGCVAYFQSKNLDNKFSIERDGTVSGIEFKPAQPLAPDESLERYKTLTEAFDSLEVSKRCSFHVHVSVDGLTHTYGINMQAWMYLYILQNISKVPKGVLERWSASGEMAEGDRYYKQKLGGSADRNYEERYSFVAFRHEFKTWEFRCWGNIKSVEDAKTCIDLSVEAYNYAFDLVHKQKKMAPLKEIDTFRENLTEMATSHVLYG